MSSESEETETVDSVRERAPHEEMACLHLVLLWSQAGEPCAGHVCAVTARALFGRASDRDRGDPPKLELVRQRPGANEPVGSLRDPKVSRRQWLLEPRGDRLAVTNLGKGQLLHNGLPVSECVAELGDTLGVDRALLALVEKRPRLLRRHGFEAFDFGTPDGDGIIGESEAAWRLRRDVQRVAAGDAHCLVLGESGSGKELVARAIHRQSARAGAPLVSRNAATIPASLVEVELFGNVANYPNPGTPARQGLIGAAEGGTLFLDEIGELGEAAQANLLRVMDSGEYQRLGEDRTRHGRLRVIAATNRPVESLKHDLVARFKEQLRVPGLNERRADVPLLLRAILAQQGEAGAPQHPVFLERLARHRYRNHFRELERLVLTFQRSSPAEALAAMAEVQRDGGLPEAGGPTELEIRAALQESPSAAEAAKRLGLSSGFALYRLMKKLGIE